MYVFECGVSSEKAASVVKGRRKQVVQDTFMEAVALGSGLYEQQWDRELSSAPWQVQGLLQTWAHAYAMHGSGMSCGLLVVVHQQVHAVLHHGSEGFRFPTVHEAENADQAAMCEVFSLCFADASFDDALSTVAVDRDMLRRLLFPRPKLQIKPREREPLKRRRAGEPGGPSAFVGVRASAS